MERVHLILILFSLMNVYHLEYLLINSFYLFILLLICILLHATSTLLHFIYLSITLLHKFEVFFGREGLEPATSWCRCEGFTTGQPYSVLFFIFSWQVIFCNLLYLTKTDPMYLFLNVFFF